VGTATGTTISQTLTIFQRNANPYTYQIRATNPVGSSAWTQVSVLVN
jgi:hypothetical protein